MRPRSFLCTEMERFNKAQSARVAKDSRNLGYFNSSVGLVEKRLLFLAKRGFFLDQAIHFIVIFKIFVSWSKLPWIKQMVEGKISMLLLSLFTQKPQI